MYKKSGDGTIERKKSNFGIFKLELLSVLLLIIISVAPIGLFPSNHYLSAVTDSDVSDEAYYFEDESEYDIDIEAGGLEDDGDDPAGSYVVDTLLLDDSASTDENSYVTVNVLANDGAYFGQNASITIDSVSSPSFGSVIINSDNNITYRPSQLRLPGESVASDTFFYTASYDNGTLQYTATVSIVIQQANDRPLVVDSEYTVANDQEFWFYLKAYDEDDDTLTFFLASFEGSGEYTLDPISGLVTYLQYQGETGEDFLVYGVRDEDSTSSLATVSITTVEGDTILISEQEGAEVGSGSGEYDEGDNEDANDLSYDYYDDHFSDDEEEEEEEQPSDDDPSDSTGTDDDDSPSSNSTGTSNNQVPIANAGINLEVLNGEQVELNGSGSYDPDGDEITYAWSQTSGSPVTLVDPEAANPTFVAPEPISPDVFLAFQLVVSDGNSTSQPSSVVVLVVAPDSGPDCTDVLTIVDTTASGYESQHQPANAIDGDLDTRWSENGTGSWIKVDLASQRDICSVDIAWYNGTTRSNDFIIEVSDDGTNFAEVYSDMSGGNTDLAESYTFSDIVAATHLRITVNGNTQNDNASIIEIVIKGQV